MAKVQEPDYTDFYESGNVVLRIDNWEDPPASKVWLRVGGCCGLELKEEDFNALLEIIDQYYEENIGDEDGT